MSNTYSNQINEAANYIRAKLKNKNPEVLLILGSGLGSLGDTLSDPVFLPYGDIPGFVTSTAEGHKGRFVAGELGSKQVLCMQGRFHFYEGYHMRDVTFPVRVAKALGINSLIVTNAAGGVNENFSAGCLMLINDHINISGNNPLIGENLSEYGVRFPDMSRAYDRDYASIARAVASDMGFELEEGVYMYFTGPNYETPTEVKLSRTLGADAVGMSTVPEVLVARHMGMRVLGISCITNMAAGINDVLLSHEEVQETADRVKTKFEELIVKTLAKMPPKFHVCIAEGLDNLPECADIRRAVFVNEQNFSENEEFDAIDSHAVHALLYDGDKAIATGRTFIADGVHKIGRMCVLKPYRGRGLGDIIIAELEKAIVNRGGNSAKLSAQCTVTHFYEKLGYKKQGEEYMDEHCPHIDMVKDL